MNLSLSCGTSQILEQTLRMSQSLKKELRQDLIQRLSLKAETIFEESSGDSADELLAEIILYILARTPEPIKGKIIDQATDKTYQVSMLKNGSALCIPTEPRINEFVRDYFYQIHGGSFRYESDDNTIERVTIPLGIYHDSFTKVDALRTELETLEAEINSGSQKDNKGTFLRRGDLLNTLLVKELVQPLLPPIFTLSKYLCTFKINDSCLLAEFFRDRELIQRLNPVLTERVIKRFLHRFKHSRRMSNNYKRTSLLNSVTEYVLVCMGVIDGEIFRLKRAEISQKQYQAKKNAFSKADLDLDQLLKHYNLTGVGPIFWNRWSVIGMKRSFTTDEMVRNFMTITVRKQSKELFEILNAEWFFSQIEDLYGPDAEFEKESLFVELLSSEEVHQKLLELCKTNWYPALDQFYRKLRD